AREAGGADGLGVATVLGGGPGEQAHRDGGGRGRLGGGPDRGLGVGGDGGGGDGGGGLGGHGSSWGSWSDLGLVVGKGLWWMVSRRWRSSAVRAGRSPHGPCRGRPSCPTGRPARCRRCRGRCLPSAAPRAGRSPPGRTGRCARALRRSGGCGGSPRRRGG